MGNQVTRAGHASTKKTDSTAHAGDTANANSLSKSSSGTELESNSHMQFFPIESLAKVQRFFLTVTVSNLSYATKMRLISCTITMILVRKC